MVPRISASVLLALIGMAGWAAAAGVPVPATVMIPAGHWEHRLDGEYSRAGRPVDAPRVPVRLERPVEIMRDLVTVGEYGRCVAAGACRPLDGPPQRPDVPVTGVNHADAGEYARWLSRETGMRWRLPSDLEWARAAGSRFIDDARGPVPAGDNPALRWLADYDRQIARQEARDSSPRPIGSFGANEHGLRDIGGNVWEWTNTCHRRVTLDGGGNIVEETRICGIYVVEGQHRAAMSFFIRNPKSGGCSVGAPPDNLGFRLVRERSWRERLRGLLAS